MSENVAQTFPDGLTGLKPQPGANFNYVDPNSRLVSFDLLERFVKDVFVAAGVPAPDAEVITEILSTADKCGIDSHGIGRVKAFYIDRIRKGILNPVTNFEVVRETNTTAVIDGHNGMGHVIAQRACDMAIAKAKEHGMGMVVCRNSTHYGIAGYYTRRAADQDIIMMVGTNARPAIAPTFSVKPMLGTNPLSFGIPSDEEFPFNLDCATAITNRGKVEVYDRIDKDIPEGWVIGQDGKYRTDSGQILKDLLTGQAALCPLGGNSELTGGYKGFGYALVVEIFSSCLQAGNFMYGVSGIGKDGKPCPVELGHFFVAINPAAFREVDDFKKQVGDVLREIRAATKAPGCERIYTPGEKEHIAYKRRTEVGGTLVPQVLLNEMVEMRNFYNLDYKFDWE
ncbi:hypothetical protein RCL1_007183 [Eukaryota sp. TZLM3-RCL]